jgi:hypothetical protein
MPFKPTARSLPELEVLGVSCLMVAKRLVSSIRSLVLFSEEREFLQDVIDHCFALVRQQKAKVFANDLHAQRVNRSNRWLAVMPKGRQAHANVRGELFRDDAVESYDQDVTTG